MAALDGVSPRSRLTLPKQTSPGRLWLHSLGECDIEPLPGGWLVRVADHRRPSSATVIDLDLTDPHHPRVEVSGGSGRWTMQPSPRHAEILALLAGHRDGLSAADLSTRLFGVADRTVTVRAEISRLRKHLGGMLAANPYRFADGVTVRVNRALADVPTA